MMREDEEKKYLKACRWIFDQIVFAKEANKFTGPGTRGRLLHVEVLAQIDHGFWYKAFILTPNGAVVCDTGGPNIYTKAKARGIAKNGQMTKTNLFALINHYLDTASELSDDRALERQMVKELYGQRALDRVHNRKRQTPKRLGETDSNNKTLQD